MMIYTWANPKLFQGVTCQSVGEYVDELRETFGGQVTAEQIVNAAKAKKSPLHTLFDWNDGEAADKWRLHQARQILGHITIIPDEKPDVGPVRAFVHVKDEGSTYQTIRQALSNEDMRGQVLSRAASEAKQWRKRYAAYRELADVFVAIDATVPKVLSKTKRGK